MQEDDMCGKFNISFRRFWVYPGVFLMSIVLMPFLRSICEPVLAQAQVKSRLSTRTRPVVTRANPNEVALSKANPTQSIDLHGNNLQGVKKAQLFRRTAGGDTRIKQGLIQVQVIQAAQRTAKITFTFKAPPPAAGVTFLQLQDMKENRLLNVSDKILKIQLGAGRIAAVKKTPKLRQVKPGLIRPVKPELARLERAVFPSISSADRKEVHLAPGIQEGIILRGSNLQGITNVKVLLSGKQTKAIVHSMNKAAADGKSREIILGLWEGSVAQAGNYSVMFTLDSQTEPIGRFLRIDLKSVTVDVIPTDPVEDQPVLPDLVVRNFSITPSEPMIGEGKRINAEVVNDGGEVYVPLGTVTWHLLVDDVVKGPYPTTGSPSTIEAGQVINAGVFGSTLPSHFPEPGTYKVEIVADPDNVLEESNENNNVLTAKVEILGGGADLIISEVVTEPANPTTTVPFKFKTTILNQGTTAITVSGRYLETEEYSGINASATFTLDPGQTRVSYNSPRPEMYNPGTYTVTFKVLGGGYDIDKTNNTYQFTFSVTE